MADFENTSTSEYDYFTDAEGRFSTEYENGTNYTTTLAPSSTADLVAETVFYSPVAYWMSFLLAVVAAVFMSVIVYRSNKRAKQERYARARANDSEFGITVADIEKDESAASTEDRFTLDPPLEDAPLSQSQLEHFGI